MTIALKLKAFILSVALVLALLVALGFWAARQTDRFLGEIRGVSNRQWTTTQAMLAAATELDQVLNQSAARAGLELGEIERLLDRGTMAVGQLRDGQRTALRAGPRALTTAGNDDAQEQAWQDEFAGSLRQIDHSLSELESLWSRFAALFRSGRPELGEFREKFLRPILETDIQPVLVRLRTLARARLQREMSEAEQRNTRTVPFTLGACTAIFLLTLIGAAAIWRTVIRPLRGLEAAARKITAGERGFRVHYQQQDEIAAVAIALNDMLDRLRATTLSRDELEQQVRARTVELERLNHELEAFSYSVSHDLRAPLRGIDSWLLALDEDSGTGLPTAARVHLARARSEAQRMGRLIDNLLRLARVSRGRIERQPLDLSALGQRIGQELQTAEPARRVEIAVTPGLTADADPVLVEAVLANLFGNAWKFTGHAAAPRIEFGRTPGSENATFFVRDNGAGFDPTYADRLFSPFHRLHKATEFPGDGIGLATVQRIIHRHGGRVWAEAARGAGATFFFTLGPANALDAP